MGHVHRAPDGGHRVAARSSLGPDRPPSCYPPLTLIAAVGVLDAAANALIAVAATHGAIGIVAVLSSLYPLATILLARAVLYERLGTTHTIGGLIALGGAALIAAG